MEQYNAILESFLEKVMNWVWGPPLLILIAGTGIYLTVLLRGMQFRYLWYALKQTVLPPQNSAEGDISQFQALMTSLAGAIGTGTIVGISTGIAIGGLGSIFWMWVTALFGMATKYAESLLAVKYRQLDERGEMCGGPMQYIEKGVGWKWMAVLFAIFGALAAIGTGNLVQVNAIAEAIDNVWDVNPWITGLVLCVLAAFVVLGGVKSIGKVSGVLVPIMASFYLIAGLVVMVLNVEHLPAAFMLIVKSAFEGQAAFGGFLGATVMVGIQTGMARSIFSNEAGLGIPSMAAAAARTDCPGRQAMITMTGALISTVIICSITGFVLALTGVQGQVDEAGKVLTGATMAIAAFDSAVPGGQYIVSIGLILFAFSTVVAWAYYGEKCFEYLFGDRAVIVYRILFCLLIIPGAALKMEVVWHIANILNAFMVIPNLIALILLSGVIVAETRVFLHQIEQEKGKSTRQKAPALPE